MVEVKIDGCLTTRGSGKEGAMYKLSRGFSSKGVMYIVTIQDVFLLVSIIWTLVQIWDKLFNRKEK